MPNIRIRQAIERIDRELNQVGEHALHHSGIEPRDAVVITNTLEDIIKTAGQIMKLAEDARPRCESGIAMGERCEWSGRPSDLIKVDWMPEHLRQSHIAAGNAGSYPENGAMRLACCPTDARILREDMKAFEAKVYR